MKGFGSIEQLISVGLLVAFCLATGCREEQIRSYRVARLDSNVVKQGAKPVPATSTVTGDKAPSRIVAAIADRPEAMWVFKIVGPPADLAATETAWRAFLDNVSFGEQKLPRWTVPDGWKELPGNSFRHATLVIPGVEPPLELAVSRLPAGQDLLLNVNRWRAQLELDPLQPDQLEAHWTKIPSGSETLLLFDATGVSAPSTSGGGPMAAPPRTPANVSAAAPSTDSVDAKLPFEFSPPEQWDAGPTTQFTLRRYLKTSGEKSVQLAITRLQTAGQAWADNVGVWCGELGIPALASDEVANQTKEIAIDGRTAKSIELQSTPELGKASRIVCWTDGAASWFIKLTGDAALVAESAADFDQFLGSIRFTATE